MFSQNIPRCGCSWTSRMASGTEARITSTSRPGSPILPLVRIDGDLLLQLQYAVDERLRSRGATRHVHVDRHDFIDTLPDGVVVEDAAAGGARAHRDHPLRLRHLVVDLPQHWGHLL